MNKIKAFSSRYPLVFLLFVVLTWYGMSLLIHLLTGSMQADPVRRLLPSMINTAAMLVYMLVAAVLFWQLGWVRAAGITRIGSGQAWLVCGAILIYLLPSTLYAFFGGDAFQTPISSFLSLYPFYVSSILESPSNISTLFSILLFTIFYESFYRGILLHVFTRSLGKSKTGVIASLVVSAAIFGMMESIMPRDVLDPSTGVLWLIRLSSALLGVWLGVLVLRWGSIWPGILLHAVLILVPIIPIEFTGSLYLRDYVTAYTRLVLFQAPLVIFGIWWVLKAPSLPAVSETPAAIAA